MNELSIIIQDTLIKDFLDGKTDKLQVITWPVSYKRFVKTDEEGAIVLDEDKVAVPLQFNKMLIKSTDGKYYKADITDIEAIPYVVLKVDKDGKEILDDNGNAIEEPSVLLYKDKSWPQYVIEYSIGNIVETESFDSPKKVNAPSIIRENWEDYKEGRRGTETIPMFQKAATPNVTSDEQLVLIRKYDPNYMLNISKVQKLTLINNLDLNYRICWKVLNQLCNYPTNIGEAEEFFIGYINSYSNYFRWSSLKERSIKYAIQDITLISLNLYAFMSEFFFPYLYVMNFIALQRFFDRYNLKIPDIPSRYNRKGRIMFYMELCKIVYQFRIDNNLTPAELCALMYDYAQRHIEVGQETLPEPSQAWLIGGSSDNAEKIANYRFWQANLDTKRGDILIHYEKYPTKAITAVWRAEENGIIDPFFWYYSNTYAGHKIDVPHITLDELKNDEFFKNPESAVGKLINKNFQGVNGWTVNGDDYKHLLDIWKQKGFDIITLPKLYAPELPKDIIINNEYDVYSNLIDPMLNDMGFKKKVDYDDQVSFKAGRGSVKRPDYCLHITGEGEFKRAKVIIEAKYYMKNNHEVEENFKQGLSYAKWGNAKILVLCDKVQILVYKIKDGYSDRNKFKKFYWKEVMGGNPDKFNELKKLLS